MSDQNKPNHFFQDNNQVIDICYDISRHINDQQQQISNNSFNNFNILESKIENIYNSISTVNERITSETNSLFGACKNQFDFFSNQISSVLNIGNNFDIKVQNLEKRVDGLYETLKRFEQNILSRFDSLEELRVSFSRIDQTVIYIGKQIDMIMNMLDKNEQKLDGFILQSHIASNTEKNTFDPLSNSKIQKIYENLESNINSSLPSFTKTNSNIDLKIDKTPSQDKRYDFNSIPTTFNFGSTLFKNDNNVDANNLFAKSKSTSESLDNAGKARSNKNSNFKKDANINNSKFS